MTNYIYSILKKYYGYDCFRGQQEEIIRSILQGNDVVAIMPTGAGKSICYQVPAVAMNGICLVVSPLISLMKDQVATLNQVGIRAAYLNTSLSYKQYQLALYNAKQGMYKIIYVAPERLMTESFLEFALQANISMVAIDEAHCISQWGHDFRPSYTKIHEFIQMFEKRPVISAFTATATEQVKNDIIAQLKLSSPNCFLASFDRSNLFFSVETPASRNEYIGEYLINHPQQSGIIYCTTRKQVEQLTQYLKEKDFSATMYHAGISDRERFENQDDFIFDRKQIMVATNAFGMGIDKSNVSFVIHYNMPMNIEAYYQEAGRAGRDGEPANCILLYQKGDVRLNQFLIQKGIEKSQIEDKVQEAIVLEREQEKLKMMTFYCTTSNCLRKFILSYFGEKSSASCNNCSSCLKSSKTVELTSEQRYILFVICKLGEKYGASMITDVLRGENNPKMVQKGYDAFQEFGVLSHLSTTEIKQQLLWLMDQEYIYKTEGDYPVFKLNAIGKGIVSKSSHIRITAKSEESVSAKPIFVDLKLLDNLKVLRRKLADKQSLPAFVIFSDATLTEMAAKKPTTLEQLSEIKGVGQVKLSKYGATFTEEITQYVQIH